MAGKYESKTSVDWRFAPLLLLSAWCACTDGSAAGTLADASDTKDPSTANTSDAAAGTPGDTGGSNTGGAVGEDAGETFDAHVAPGVDSGPPVDPFAYSRCRLALPGHDAGAPGALPSGDAGDAAAPTPGAGASDVWPSSFEAVVTDVEGDDVGSGAYVYPSYVDPVEADGGTHVGGMADLTAFRLAYDASAQTLSFSVGLRNLTDNSRVGVVLYDEKTFPKPGAPPLTDAELEWSMTGNELRLPNWNVGGLTFLLAKPGPDNPTYDIAVRRNLGSFGMESRPDNAVYFERGGWPRCDGTYTGTEQRQDILELDVTASDNTLSFSVPVQLLKGQIDLETSSLYAIVYAYVLADRTVPEVEFGSVEITEALGGLADSEPDNWRDPDVYDLAFAEGAAQATLLTAPTLPVGGTTATDGTKLVVIHEVGKGVLEIPTRPAAP